MLRKLPPPDRVSSHSISVPFKLYLIEEFQGFKTEEQELLSWSAKRELSKINYRIHTDAIKTHIPFKHGEFKCCVYRTSFATERATYETQPNSNPSDEHIG